MTGCLSINLKEWGKMDIWDKEKRSKVMSNIRSKDTKPEILVRKMLHSNGIQVSASCKKPARKT